MSVFCDFLDDELAPPEMPVSGSPCPIVPPVTVKNEEDLHSHPLTGKPFKAKKVKSAKNTKADGASVCGNEDMPPVKTKKVKFEKEPKAKKVDPRKSHAGTDAPVKIKKNKTKEMETAPPKKVKIGKKKVVKLGKRFACRSSERTGSNNSRLHRIYNTYTNILKNNPAEFYTEDDMTNLYLPATDGATKIARPALEELRKVIDDFALNYVTRAGALNRLVKGSHVIDAKALQYVDVNNA